MASTSTLTANAAVTNQSGTIEVNGTFLSEGGFVEQAGTTADGSVQIVFGQLSFDGTGASSFSVPPGSGIGLAGDIASDQSLTISNASGDSAGTVVTATAAFTNAGTITFVAGSSGRPADLSTGTSVLTNSGTIAFTGPSGAASRIDGPVDNQSSGILSVADSVDPTLTGSVTNAGIISVVAGTLDLSGGLTNLDAATHTLSGGTYQVLGTANAGADLIISGATITTLGASVEIGPSLGARNSFNQVTAITPGGTLTVDRGATAGYPGTALTNDGTVALQPSASLLTDAYTQGATGSLTVGVDGEPAANELGTLTASGAASLSGTLNIAGVPGFVPTLGDTYTPVTGTSVTGTFSLVTGEAIDPSLVYATVYTATSAQLVVEKATIDLAAKSVSGPASAPVGHPVTVTWTVGAVAGSASGSWTDSVYLSRNTTAGPGAVLIGTAVHHGGISLNGTYAGTLTAMVPGIVPGNYHFVVVADSKDQTADANRANNVGASNAVTVTMTRLAVGATTAGTIPAHGDTYVEIDPTAGTNLVVTATFNATATGALFEAFGRIPGPGGYDLAPASTSDVAQSVTIAGAQMGAYFVDLNDPTSSAVTFSLSVRATSLAVTSVTPASAAFVTYLCADCVISAHDPELSGATEAGRQVPGTPRIGLAGQGVITATIGGVGFTPTSTVTLVCTGVVQVAGGPHGNVQVPATSVTFVNATTLYASFGTAFSTGGTCAMRVANGGATAELAGALKFVGVTQLIEAGQTFVATPEVTLVAPSVNRPEVDSAVVVDYQNPYAYAIPAPLLQLTATGATLHFTDQPAGDGSTLLILGTAPSGDPGVLEPGAAGSVQVLFDSTLAAHQSVSFELDTLNNLSGTVDFGSILASILPAGTPAAVTNYVKSKGGVISAAEMQADLGADATYLSSLGENVSDTSTLFGYELNKLDDYGALVPRYTAGPFGLGLPGIVDHVSVDAKGNVTVRDPAEHATVFAARPGGSFAAPAGVSSTLAAGAGGGWVMTQPNGSTDTFAANGQVLSATDSYGNRATYAYSGGNLSTVTDPTGDTVSYTYNGAREVTSTTDSASGQVSVLTYDGTGHLASVQSAGSTVNYSWNSSSANPALNGTLTAITDGDGVKLTYSYDALGRPTSIKRGDGTTAENLTYNSDNTTTITDGAASKTIVYPDGTGAVVRALLPDGTVASSTLNALSEPVTTTLGGATDQYGYDAQGDLTSATNPLGQTMAMSYSAAGVLSGFTEPLGNGTTISSNREGDPTKVTAPDGSSSSITYSAAGLITSKTDRRGVPVSFGYDAGDKLTAEMMPDGSVNTFTYDAHHDLLSATNATGTTTFTYDSSNRITSVAYPNGLGVAYTYDPDGLVSTMTTTDGYEVAYHYDTAGRLGSVTDTGGTKLSAYTYSAAGHLASVTNDNGTSTDYTYDNRGDIATVVNHASGGAITSHFAYTRNELGETTSMVDGQGTTNYGYNAAGELTAATLPGGRVLTYSYDANGNRTATTDTASGPATYAVNVDDEYKTAGATTYSYDADGNLASSTTGGVKTTYAWDALGRLAAVTGPSGTTTYAYDALGTLVSENIDGATTNILTDPTSDTLLGQYSSSGSPINHYVLGEGVAAQVDPSGAASYYGFDGSGNVVSLSNPSGSVADSYQYTPFGQVSASTGTVPNPFTFGGQFGVTNDAGSGFYQDRARYYDPSTGRFVSQDPNMLSGPNPYEYAGNNPVDNTDLTGLDTSTASATIGGAFTGVTQSVVDAAQEGLVGGPGSTPAQTVGTSAGTLASSVGTLGESLMHNAANLVGANLPGATQATRYLSQDVGALAHNVANIAQTAGQGLAGVNGLINLASDLNQFRNPTSSVPQYKSGSNALVHFLNVPLEIAAIGAGGPFAPWAPALIEGGEAAIDEGSQAYFDWYFEPEPNPNVFGPRCGGTSGTVTAHDPNDMIGPSGFGPAGFVKGGTPLPYEVDFTNEANADVPAVDVTITEPLDPNMNLSSFSLGSFGFARHVITPPSGLRSYSTTIDDTKVSGLDVNVTANLDTTRRTVTWTFTSIDPATSLPPTSATAGFLPPDKKPPQGEGFVSYTVIPNASAKTGTKLSAHASVTFDTNAPLTTSTVTNTLDVGAPRATVEPLPAKLGAHFMVRWSGSDPGGSGIASYSVFVAEDKGPLVALKTNTTATSTAFTGVAGHLYTFIAQASNNVGNTQILPTAGQAHTTVVPPPAVARLSPDKGLTLGGTLVTITGSNLSGATAVHFGSALAHVDKAVSATELEVTVPRGSGIVDVTVTTVAGTSARKTADRYSYVLPPQGYYLAGRNGTILAVGGVPALAGFSTPTSDPVTGITTTPDGKGWFAVTADGLVTARGDATYRGDLLHPSKGGKTIHVSDIVAIVDTADGGGYWLLGADGEVYPFGDATFHGDLLHLPGGKSVHVTDVVGMVAAPSGSGYLLIGSDGGVFALGAVHFYGSLPGVHVTVHDITGILPAPGDTGYVLVGADGGAFVFGHGAPFKGSLPGEHIHVSDIVGLALTSDGQGYWMAGSNGVAYAFGDAKKFPSPAGLANALPIAAIGGT